MNSIDEIEKLKIEIKVLSKRVSVLEARENRRAITRKFKIIFNILFYCTIIFGLWYAYDYVTNQLPNQIKDNITNMIPDIFH